MNYQSNKIIDDWQHKDINRMNYPKGQGPQISTFNKPILLHETPKNIYYNSKWFFFSLWSTHEKSWDQRESQAVDLRGRRIVAEGAEFFFNALKIKMLSHQTFRRVRGLVIEWRLIPIREALRVTAPGEFLPRCVANQLR